MARYTTIKSNDAPSWMSDVPLLPNLCVDDSKGLTDIGLLDSNGDTIYRFPIPIGFGRDEEW